MHHNFVVTVCGPHQYDDRDSPCYNRVDAATQAALYYNAVLLICGDARGGQDVTRFAEQARKFLPHDAVIACYDPGGNTLSDVQAALRAIREVLQGEDTAEVLLVTDEYHMRRFGIFFRGEMAKMFARGQLQVRDFGMPAPPRAPTDLELAREEEGLCDYLAGVYGQHDGHRWGKPAVDAIVAPPAASTSPSGPADAPAISPP